jgi:hypothetical protein
VQDVSPIWRKSDRFSLLRDRIVRSEYRERAVDSKQAEIENMSQNQESTPNPRKGNVIWSVVVLGAAAVSAALWLVFALPGRVALVTGCAAVFATAFAVAPYVRFIDHGWWTRYDEFRNQL